MFWVGKFGKYFFGWLDLSGDLFGYSKQSEDSWYRGSTRVSWLPLVFFRVISFPALRKFVREFFGFCLKPKGFFFVFRVLPSFDHSRDLKSGVPNPSPPPRVQPVLSLGSSFLVTSPDVKSNSPHGPLIRPVEFFPHIRVNLTSFVPVLPGTSKGQFAHLLSALPKQMEILK